MPHPEGYFTFSCWTNAFKLAHVFGRFESPYLKEILIESMESHVLIEREKKNGEKNLSLFYLGERWFRDADECSMSCERGASK